MQIGRMMICLDCDETFEAKYRCPRCGSEAVWPMAKWVRPVRTIRAAQVVMGPVKGVGEYAAKSLHRV